MWLKWRFVIAGYCLGFLHSLLDISCFINNYLSFMSLSVTFIFGTRNFHSRCIWYKKPALKTGTRKWSRFIAQVSAMSVISLTHGEDTTGLLSRFKLSLWDSFLSKLWTHYKTNQVFKHSSPTIKQEQKQAELRVLLSQLLVAGNRTKCLESDVHWLRIVYQKPKDVVTNAVCAVDILQIEHLTVAVRWIFVSLIRQSQTHR